MNSKETKAMNGITVSETSGGNIRLEVRVSVGGKYQRQPLLRILTPEEAMLLAKELERLARQCL